MAVAMGLLAVGAFGMGLLQIPHVTDVVHHFLEPTFADSRYKDLSPSDGLTIAGLLTGTVLAISGIALAYHLWVRETDAPGALRARLGRPAPDLRQQVVLRRDHQLPDRAAVRVVRALRAQHVRAGRDLRPVHGRHDRRGARGLGRRARGTVGVTCATTRRCCCSGSPASAPTSSWRGREMDQLTIHLSVLIFWPLGAGADRGARAAQLGARVLGRRRGRATRLRRDDAVRLRAGPRAPVRHQRHLDPGAGHPLQARRRRAQPVADRADHAAVLRGGGVAGVPPRRAPEAVPLPPRAGRDRGAGRVRRAGPGAVRPLLRPDAGAVLLPRRAVGHRARAGVGDLQADHLHARRLAPDAGGRGRHRGARRPTAGASPSR